MYKPLPNNGEEGYRNIKVNFATNLTVAVSICAAAICLVSIALLGLVFILFSANNLKTDMNNIKTNINIVYTEIKFPPPGDRATGYTQFNDPDWIDFKQKYGKVYEDVVNEKVHYNNFLENINSIKEHNKKFDSGLVSYYKGINQYTDMTFEEVKKIAFGFKYSNKYNVTGNAHIHKPAANDVPKSVDWRTKGVVTPVKDQGDCGSCWAFSTTGALEGQHALATGKLVSLSEQNLVDCTTEEGNEGCNGGFPYIAYEYIIRVSGGLDTEAGYPYVGIDQQCSFDPEIVGANETAFSILTPGSESGLQEAVANVGPISVCINANDNFMSYAGGVFDDPECTSDFDAIDHCVLAVGYGTDTTSDKDYWLVKNSWNTTWGEEGYIKMVRNKKNQCAISTLASYPTVKPV